MSIPIKGEEVKLTSADPTTRAAIGAAQQLAEGKLPSPGQIEQVLETTKKVIEEQPDTQITKDTKTLIEDTEKLLKEKNRDGQLQKFIDHALQLAKDIPEGLQKVETDKLTSEPLKIRGQKAAESLKNLVYSLIKSGEFRALLLEFIDLGYIVFVKASGEAQALTEQKVKEVEPYLTSAVAGPVPTTLKSASDTYGAFGSQTGAMTPTEIAMVTTSGPPVAPTTEGPSRTLFEALKSDVAKEDTNMSGTKEVVDKTKEAVSEVFTKLKEGDYIPESERRELSLRYEQLMDKLVYNAELRNATHNVLSMIDYIQFLMKEITNETEKKVVDYEELKQLWKEGKAVIENFASNKNLDNLERLLWEFFTILRDDTETNQFFSDLRNYITTSLDHPHKLKEEDWRRKGEALFNWGRGLMQSDKYQLRIRLVLEELKDTVDRVSHDPLIKEVTEDITKLSHDILLDDSGKPSLDKLKNAVHEIKTWVVPILRKELEAVLVPRIEGSTPKYEYWVDNVTLAGKDIIPEKILIDFDTLTEINVSEIAPEEISSELTVQVKDVATHFKDIRFWLKRTVMPTYEDSGVVDIDVDNVSFCLKWKVQSTSEGPWKFQVHEAKISIGHFLVRIRDAKHNVLDKVLMKLFNNVIRKTIEAGVENYLKEKLGEWNTQLEKIVNRRP